MLLRPESRDGKLVVNTHFRNFNKPMGFAWERGRFAPEQRRGVGVSRHPGRGKETGQNRIIDRLRRGFFLPGICHMTGDIQVHEMVWQPENLNGNGLGNGLASPPFAESCARGDQISISKFLVSE